MHQLNIQMQLIFQNIICYCYWTGTDKNYRSYVINLLEKLTVVNSRKQLKSWILMYNLDQLNDIFAQIRSMHQIRQLQA